MVVRWDTQGAASLSKLACGNGFEGARLQRKRSRAISPDLESGFSPRRLFPNLERVPQRLKPDFRPVLTARLRFAEAVPLQNLRKPRNTPANLDSLAACCVSICIYTGTASIRFSGDLVSTFPQLFISGHIFASTNMHL